MEKTSWDQAVYPVGVPIHWTGLLDWLIILTTENPELAEVIFFKKIFYGPCAVTSYYVMLRPLSAYFLSILAPCHECQVDGSFAPFLEICCLAAIANGGV